MPKKLGNTDLNAQIMVPGDPITSPGGVVSVAAVGNGSVVVTKIGDPTLTASAELEDVAAAIGLGSDATLDDVRHALGLPNDATLDDAIAVAATSFTKTLATTDQLLQLGSTATTAAAGNHTHRLLLFHIPDNATSYSVADVQNTVHSGTVLSNALQISLPSIDQDTVLCFELWVSVPTGATGSVSYMYSGSSVPPVCVGSLNVGTGFLNKLALRWINDAGVYSLEENVYLQKGL